MKMGMLIFSIILFLLYCTPQPKAGSDVIKGIDTIANTVDSVSHEENFNKVLLGNLLFQVEVTQFFRQGAINDIGYNETSLKYLMPVSFFKDSNHFYIPDRSRLALRVLDIKGKFSSSIDIPLKDFAFYKIEKIFSDWYLLDIEKGLIVLDKESKFKYKSGNSVDFHFDRGLDNIYIENTLNSERALIDQRGILKKPFEISYLNCYVNNSILSGISLYKDSIYSIVRWDMEKASKIDSISLPGSCRGCFVLPFFLDEDCVLSSTDKPTLMDQISIIDRSSSSVAHYILKYPFKIKALISDESAGYTYSGFIYFYDKASKILYSLCTDQNTVKVFFF